MPSRTFGYPIEIIEQRFWSKVEKTDGCWVWRGRRGGKKSNYGMMSVRPPGRGHRDMAAHRVAYTLLVGSIPPALVIDHLCRQTLCVRPDHLEAVTSSENGQRAWVYQMADALGMTL